MEVGEGEQHCSALPMPHLAAHLVAQSVESPEKLGVSELPEVPELLEVPEVLGEPVAPEVLENKQGFGWLEQAEHELVGR